LVSDTSSHAPRRARTTTCCPYRACVTSRPTSQRRCAVSIAFSQAPNCTGLASEGASSGRVWFGCTHSVATATSTSASDRPAAGGHRAALDPRAVSDPPAPAGTAPTPPTTATPSTPTSPRATQTWIKRHLAIPQARHDCALGPQTRIPPSSAGHGGSRTDDLARPDCRDPAAARDPSPEHRANPRG